MKRFDTCRESFPNARLTRSKTGVLEVGLHTDGDTLAHGHKATFGFTEHAIECRRKF